MKKEEYFQKLVTYAKKLFGLALTEVLIVERHDGDGSYYFNLEIRADMPIEVLKQYHKQIQEYYYNIAQKQKFDIYVYLTPRNGLRRNNIAMHGRRRIYVRPDYFDIQELLPTKS